MDKGIKLMIDPGLEMTDEKSYRMKTSGVCPFILFFNLPSFACWKVT